MRSLVPLSFLSDVMLFSVEECLFKTWGSFTLTRLYYGRPQTPNVCTIQIVLLIEQVGCRSGRLVSLCSFLIPVYMLASQKHSNISAVVVLNASLQHKHTHTHTRRAACCAFLWLHTEKIAVVLCPCRTSPLPVARTMHP